MSLRQTKIYPLSFDPTKTNLQEGETSHFEWAIDHEEQADPAWCWAACLSNALTCVGRYVEQKEIVEKFLSDQGFSLDMIDDERIPSPESVRRLWRSFGFYEAAWRDEQMPFEALAEEIAGNGPVQIELWRETDNKNRHLALIVGVRKIKSIPEVYVSDPDSSLLEPKWYSYADLQGSNPLPSNFGEWRRTYVNLAYQKGYLRRFFGRPSSFLKNLNLEEGGLDGVAVPQVTAMNSQLEFQTPPDPDPPLTKELALGSYGYRFYRYCDAPEDKRPTRKADIKQPLFLFESIPIWEPPSELKLGKILGGQLRFRNRWHHQIHDAKGRPRYYAHADFFEKLRRRNQRSWRTAWVGERWLAERVDNAIQKLDSDSAGLSGEVRMVWFGRHGLVTLLLPDGDHHCIVSAYTRRLTDFPLGEMFTDKQLRGALRRLS
jgi:peptidase C39-like protein